MAKKLLFLFVALVAMATAVPALAGTGQKVKQARKVAPFERIKVTGSIKVKYVQDNTQTVVVAAPKDLLPRVLTRVDGNRLAVSVKGENFGIFKFGNDSELVTVSVSSPDLIGVELSGSGDFECKRHLDTDNLDVLLKGSGDIEFADIICDNLKATVVGSGDLEVKKLVAQRVDIVLAGSGDIKISEQRVRQTKVVLKGSGDVKLHLTGCGSIDTRQIGSGDVTLSGDVGQHTSYSRGSGDVITKMLQVKNKK